MANDISTVIAAENYISIPPFSRSGLTGQLKFEDYDSPDAEFAVGTIEVNRSHQSNEHPGLSIGGISAGPESLSERTAP